MLGRVDLVPGIAGDDPARGRLVLQRIEIFRLAAQEIDHDAIFECAAGRALADEFGQIAGKQRAENRIRLGVIDGLRHRAGIDLAERGRLLGDEFHVRLLRLHHLLEGRGGRLAIFEIWIDQRPALFLRRQRVGQQHRHLHVGRGPQPEGIAVAVRPGDLVGQRLGGEKEHLLLAGEFRDRQSDIGQKRAEENVEIAAGRQFLGDPHRVARIGAVVARDDLKLPAQHAAGGVDLIDSHFPALLVGVEKGRLALVAIELADLDRLLRRGRRCRR